MRRTLRRFAARASARRLAFALALLGPCACNARIDQFTASPHYICPGQAVHLTWKVVGNPSIRVTPPASSLPDGKLQSEGEATLTPSRSTSIELRVTRVLGHPTASIQEIRVADDPKLPRALTTDFADPAANAGCRDGQIWATVKPKNFSSELKVASVAEHVGDARRYVVEHAGVRAEVSPERPAPDFRGKPAQGDWIIRSPLAPGEACGTEQLPRSLSVDVFFECSPGDLK